MRHRSLTGVLGLVAAVVFGIAYVAADAARQDVATPSAAPVPLSSAAAQRALLNRYCVSCHNDKVKTGGLALDTIDIEHVDAELGRVGKAVRKLRVRAMPPAGPGRPRPDEAGYESLIAYLESSLDRAAASEAESRAHRHLPSAQPH